MTTPKQTHSGNGLQSSGKKVVLGMSGGVDSSVAGARLLEAGYEVTGLFMKNWDEDDGTEYCTAIADFADAQSVAQKLGIELHSANFAAEYWDQVFEEFLADYAAGFTPNPDVLCNREIKFKQFADYAERLGADYIATGHYARVHNGQLLKALDTKKDQSYFLQDVPIERLRRCLFPLGEIEKTAVRAQARELGLDNHAKKDSTGICFIGERRFADFLSTYLPEAPGPIVDEAGRTLGKHRGTPYYTVGQRQGLGIGGRRTGTEAAWYVMHKDRDTNTLTVTQRPAALESSWLRCSNFNWLVDQPTLPLRANAKVRYRQPDQAVTVYPAADGGYRLAFDHPQRAVAPGQYACLYDGAVCLGGGRIAACGSNSLESLAPVVSSTKPTSDTPDGE